MNFPVYTATCYNLTYDSLLLILLIHLIKNFGHLTLYTNKIDKTPIIYILTY